MPELEPFLKHNHFIPEEIRFSRNVIMKLFDANIYSRLREEASGVKFEEIRGWLQENGVYYSDAFIQNTLIKLSETKLHGFSCPAVCCTGGKWHCTTIFS